VSVHIIQSQSHILNTYDEKISDYAEKKFKNDKIEVVTNARVSKVTEDTIYYTLKCPDGTLKECSLPQGVVVLSTGVTLNPLTERVRARLPNVQKNHHALETDAHLRVLGAPLGDVYAVGDCATVQNNIAGHIVDFLKDADIAGGRDPQQTNLSFEQWSRVAEKIKRKFPQAATHLKRLDKIFSEADKDHSGRVLPQGLVTVGTLDYMEIESLLKIIDAKLTSLPATAQRAHQQGYTPPGYVANAVLTLRRNSTNSRKNNPISYVTRLWTATLTTRSATPSYTAT
jgi:NADH:quinone reductase (non-electrogenic)